MFTDVPNRHVDSEAFPGWGWTTCYFLLAYNKRQKSLDTPSWNVFTRSFITLKMIIRLTCLSSHFDASWLSGQNAVVLSTPTPGLLTEPWEALWPPGLPLPTQDLPCAPGIYCLLSWLLLAAPTSSSHAMGDLTIPCLAHSSSPPGSAFYAPFDWTLPLQLLCLIQKCPDIV